MITIERKVRHVRFGYLLLLCTILIFGPFGAALAWDAGNPAAKSPKYSKTLCVNSECSGGVVEPELNFAGKISSWFATSRVADCPKGYTNNGLTCGRGAHSISAPSRLADCPSGYTNNGPVGCGRGASTYSNPSSVADCPRGYTNMGLDCQKGANIFDRKGMSSMTCPSGSVKRGARCYPKCKPGYTNNGEFCGRGVSQKGPSAFSCPRGYFQGVTKSRCHKNCPAGYRNMGETCFRGVDTKPLSSMTCKNNEVFESGRCITMPNVKLRGNTHLWVVNRALDLLSRSPDPVARRAVNTMRANGCANKWRQGLYDGDETTFVDDPLQLKRPTAGTHFYNPTGKDYFGRPTKAVTYLMGGMDASTGGFSGVPNLNARQSADKQIKNIPTSGPNAQKGCYQLGLALHYLTDMTQPMHASSFSAVSEPRFLHPYFEAYVPVIQTRFPARGTFQPNAQTRLSPDSNFESIARKGNALAPALMRTLTANGKQCTISGVDLGPLPYIGYCFLNDRKVDQQVGTILQSAYQSTAHYIYSVFNSFGNTAVTTNPGTTTNNNGNTGTNNNPQPGTTGSAGQEQNCFNMIQGRVAWNQAGSKQWGPANIKKLCSGTRNPSQTIGCFQRGIAAHNDWARAINDCAGKF